MAKNDVLSFSNGGASLVPPGAMDRRWWLSPPKERPHAITSVVKSLASFDSRRQTQYQISTRLYGNVNLMGLSGLSMNKIASVQHSVKDRISYNVIQSCTDTITAKMAKNKPVPMFLTSGGQYKIQRKAKKLDKFVEGVFYENDAYALGTDIFRDSCILGDGFVQVYDLHGRVKYERVIASELYVDWMESFYGEPRQLHRVKNVDRAVLCDLFPNKKAAIMGANSASADLIGGYQNVADQVTVVESWHLRSGPGATDGLHTINLENNNLFEEAWEKDCFPFAKLPWSKRLYGYWGQSLAEQIQPAQLEINKILMLIQRTMHLAGTFKVWMKTGSKLPKEHINNEIGAIITGEEMPQYLIPPMVQPEYYSHLQTLKTSAFEQAGISQLSATSQKPAGLNSGKALRTYNDIETERFMTTGQAYERFFMQLAKLSVSVGKDIHARNNNFEVRAPGKRFFETIPWSDVDLRDDQYVMRIYPTSSLPNDPAGRIQTVQEYIQAGFMDPLTGQKLLDFPDLEQYESLAQAQEDWITMVLDKIVDGTDEDNGYTPPEPEMKLDLAAKLVLQYIAKGHVNGLDPEKLALLNTWNDQLVMMDQKAKLAAQAAAQPALGGPQGVPAPRPISELLTNVPGAA